MAATMAVRLGCNKEKVPGLRSLDPVCETGETSIMPGMGQSRESPVPDGSKGGGSCGAEAGAGPGAG